MTTVPGHNQILQQSGVAQELSQQSQTAKPDPEQAAALQQVRQTTQNTQVQRSEKSDQLKQKKRHQSKQKKATRGKRRPRKGKDQHPDPGATGQLLDRTA